MRLVTGELRENLHTGSAMTSVVPIPNFAQCKPRASAKYTRELSPSQSIDSSGHGQGVEKNEDGASQPLGAAKHSKILDGNWKPSIQQMA